MRRLKQFLKKKATRAVMANSQASLVVFILTGIFAMALNGCQSPSKAVEHPNIVLIVADDFGYGDLGCYGATKVKTPNIDQLAADGIRFTDAYVVSSLCSPSRYSILTGRYSWRTHLKSGVLKTFAPPLIEDGRLTLAVMLKGAGYYTACVGKWHLGFNWALKENAPADAATSVFESWGTEPQNYIDFSKPVKAGPIERGFDYFYGISGANNMMPFVFLENDSVLQPPSVPNNFGTQTLRAPDWDLRYLDQKFTHKAVQVIDDHFQKRQGNPLFLYFPASAIHRPCLPTFTKGKSEAGMRGDMVLEFDWMVGQIVKALEKHSALENTLLIVTSDNGPQPGDPVVLVERFKKKAYGEEYDYYEPYFARYQPEYPGNGGMKDGWLVYGHDPTAGLLGFKSDGWEGGLRVPFIVHWPAKIKGGQVNSGVVCAIDLMATIAEITGIQLAENEAEDSYSFLPALLNKDAQPSRKSLTMVAGRTGALVVRQGDWKYIEPADPENWSESEPYQPDEYPGFPGIYEPQLYNLKEDIGERNNLFDREPEKVKELAEIIRKVREHPGSEDSL